MSLRRRQQVDMDVILLGCSLVVDEGRERQSKVRLALWGKRLVQVE